MHAIIYNNTGGPEVLTLADIPTPSPGPEQLLVRVQAAALNRADLLQRRGKYSPPAGESTILGLEIAGEITALGSQVTHHKIGDRICGLVGGGAYAEYCLIDHKVAMPIPSNLSYIEAAAIPEAFLTASEALFTLGDLQTGENILIHAGGSGVGTAAIQLAQQVQAQIYATVGSNEKKTKLDITLHPAAIINYKEENFAEQLKQLTQNKGVNVIIDFIGASYFAENLQSLSMQGRLVCVGLMGGTTAEINLERVLRQRLQIKGLIMRARSIAEKRVMTQHFIHRWLPLFASGKLKPIIDSVFPLQEAQAAHRQMESNTSFGKIILTLA